MIDRLVNVVFTVCCLALSGLAVFRHWPEAAPAPLARESVLAAGARDPFALPAAVAGRARLCVLISPQCRSCTESLPFYRRLAVEAERADGAELIFAGLEPEEELRTYLHDRGGPKVRVVSLARPPDLPGTPSIVAMDGSGRVTRSWAGRLGPRQEADVLAIVAGPPPATALLAEARTRLNAGRSIETVSSIEVTGAETLLQEAASRTTPYAFGLLLPASLQLRAGPVVHTLADTAYARRLADVDRYGGTVVERLLTDPESMKTATHGMQLHLIRLAATFLARVPDAVAEDEGIRDFGSVKGRTVRLRRTADGLQAELVLDPATSRPLAVVTPVYTVGGVAAGTTSSWISLLEDYRPVSGVLVPHRLDEWIGLAHSRVDVTNVRIDLLTPEYFASEMKR
jgi:hypothetical protein